MAVTGAREELEHALASKTFANSPRLRRLLRYIVEKSLAGDRESLKEYSIGLDVFDQDASFDPKTDSIVRGTARQLRLKLDEYYRTEGETNRVRIAVPKGSYVAEFAECATPPPPSKAKPWRKQSLAAVAMVALIALAATLAVHGRMHSTSVRTIAVLPLRDLSPHHDLQYIQEQLHDGLASILVGAKGLEVTARASSGEFEGRADPVSAAKAMQADAVVLGSIAPDGEGFQATIQLADGKTGRLLWSQTYERRPSDVAALEHAAAAGIAAALGAVVKTEGPALPKSAQALDLFLRASSLARTREPAAMQQASGMFERLLAIEPDFAPGYAAAASNSLVAAGNGKVGWNEAGPRGIALARKAVALDGSLAEAHAALGLGLDDAWQWDEAGVELGRALALDPRSPIAYFREAVHLASIGRFAEAERAGQAAQVLDPSWNAPAGLTAEIYYYERRWNDALEQARRLREMWHDAEFADNICWRVYIAEGNYALARPCLAAHPDPYNRAWLRLIGGDARGAWQELTKTPSTEYLSSFRLAAFALTGMGDRRSAMDLLEESFRVHEPDLCSLAIDPVFDPIRSMPRVQALEREMNLGGISATAPSRN